MANYDITPLNKVIRGSKRATYDAAQIHAILDSKFLCHIAYTWEGKAIVIPTAYGRDEDKIHALQCILNHMVPGHWDYVRQPNEKELNATLVLELSIETASAKIRAEGAVDEKEDYDLPLWAGVIPVTEQIGEPIRDTLLADTIETPPSVVNYVQSRLKNKK